ncbi:MAG: hypothetical protein HRU15_04045 [Planctomycetes bacterium]|nr:hypothetical protein [Planctomycetota bacterium]
MSASPDLRIIIINASAISKKKGSIAIDVTKDLQAYVDKGNHSFRAVDALAQSTGTTKAARLTVTYTRKGKSHTFSSGWMKKINYQQSKD